MKTVLIVCASKIVGLFYRLISIFVRMDSKMCFFISFSGKNYDSNPKYFYEYLSSARDDLKYVWCFRHVPNVSLKNAIQVKYRSLKHYYYLAKCKYWFFDVGITGGADISRGRHSIVFFTHGSPYKKMGKDIPNHSTIDAYGDRLISKLPNYVLAQSDTFAKLFSKCYGIPIEKFLLIGYPRTDILLKNNIGSLQNAFLQRKWKNVIIYIPTMREWDNQSNCCSNLIERITLGEDECLIYKSHPSHRIHINGENIIDATDIASINDLYNVGTLLLTDYSSAMFDFSLLDKPVVLFQYDKNEYLKNRGLYFSESEIIYPVFTDIDSLNKFLRNIFDNPHEYTSLCNKVSLFKNKFLKNESPKTCEELYKIVFKD